MTLTSEYQYIGRTNGVKAYGSSYYYYILLYAKTSGSSSTGKHTVSVKMRLACTASASFYKYDTTGSATVDGKSAISWTSSHVPSSTWESGTLTEDGYTYKRYIDLREGSVEIDTQYAQKNVVISASWKREAINSTPPDFLAKTTQATASITVTLPVIPSASTITSVENTNLGSNCSVVWTPKAAAFRYKLRFSLGTWSHTTGVIHPNKNTAYTYSDYTIPLDVANQVTTKTGTMTVTLYTYSDSGATAQVGSASSKTFTVTVPENDDTKPTVATMSVSPVSDLKAPFNTLYLQGNSKVKATLTFETKYNATVAASSITVGGNVYESPYESDILNQTGTVSVKATVKDSRGHYGTNYREIEVIPYSKPYVRSKSGESEIIATRCDSSANIIDSGTYLKIKAKIVYEKVISNGVQNNFGKIKFRYRSEGGAYSAWQTILDCKTTNSDEVITAPLLNGALDVKTNYQVQILATDDLYESVPVTIAVPSDDVYMDRPAGGKSMALGGYSTGDGILDVYWRTKARGGLSVFDAKGDEIPLDSTMPIPRDQLKGTWNPDDLECGIHVITDSSPLKSGENVIMYNGVLIQMPGTAGELVKFQLTLPVDGNKSPMYRVNWYSNWSDWRSLKL